MGLFGKRSEIQATKWDNYTELRDPIGVVRRTGNRTDITYRGNDREIKQMLRDSESQSQFRQLQSKNESDKSWIAPVTTAAVVLGAIIGVDISS